MKRNAHRCCRLVPLLLILLTAAMSARAFDTWWFWGGEVHEIKLITEPLWQCGLQQDRIKKISDGANSQDIQGSSNFEKSPQNHFDDDKIKEGAAYVQEQMNAAVRLAREAWMAPAPAVIDKETCVGRALYALGQGLHTAQDFYCHTDYLELQLRYKRPLVPVDYTKVPPEVHSGHFYWYDKVFNEGTTMPAVPDALVNDRERVAMEQMPTDPFVMDLVKKRRLIISWMTNVPGLHTDEEFQRRVQNPTYAGALAYVTDGTPLLHFECAKDNPKSLQGRIIIQNSKETLYTQALQLARAATVQQWLLFEKMIREDPDQARIAAWNLAALKGRPFPKLKILSLEPKTPISPKDKISGIAKIQLMHVDALSAEKSQWFKLQIKVAGILGSQRGEYTVGQATGGVGDGVYDIPLDTLNLSAPDECGEVTLKLEITLADDPTPYAEFGTAPLTVELRAPSATGNVWTRGEGVSDLSRKGVLEVGPTSARWQSADKSGKPVSSTLTWVEPPMTITEGQDVPLRLDVSPWAGPQFCAQFFSWDLGNASRRVAVNTMFNKLHHAEALRFALRAKSSAAVVIMLSVNNKSASFDNDPERKERFIRTWTYTKAGAADLGKPSLIEQTPVRAPQADLANAKPAAGPQIVGGPAGGAVGATPPKPPSGQPGTTPPPDSSVTTVAGEVDVKSAAGDTLDVKAGAALPAGEAVEIRTGASGTISVRLPSGATVLVMPSSVVRIEVDGRVILNEGSVNGDTGTQPGDRKMEVIAPAAQVTDDGTRFSVSHDPIKNVTTVAVAEGAVRVRPTNAGAAARRVEAGARIAVPGPATAANASAIPAAPKATPALQGISSTLVFSALKPGYISGEEFRAVGVRLTASKGRLHVLPAQLPAMVMPAGQTQVLAVAGDRVTEFALEFNPPVKAFTLTLPGLRGGASFPTYSITAFNPAGASFDMVGQQHWIPSVPAPARITLDKGMMSRAVIFVDNRFGNTAWATYSCLPIAEIELQR